VALEQPTPTPYADVNAIVHAILAGARGILGDGFVGMYLGGSLASGDFDPQNSDIDFVVVTATELAPETIGALTVMHAAIAAGRSKWATEIEGSYIPQHALRRYDATQARHPHIYRGTGEDESRLMVMHHASDWVIHRHIWREQGIIVAGPPPHTLIDAVAPEELRRAAVSFAPDWLGSLLRDPAPLRHNGYHAYTVVTLCRILYTLEHGAIVSKPVAARWAQTAVAGGRWASLIARAVAWDMQWASIDETLEFLRHTLNSASPVTPPDA
jgi:hypothetical protein